MERNRVFQKKRKKKGLRHCRRIDGDRAKGATRISAGGETESKDMGICKTVSACVRAYDRNAERGSSVDAER